MCFVLSPNCKIENGFPTKFSNKGKSMVFLKAKGAPISQKDAVNKAMLTMEVQGNSPFEHLELISSEVFLPVLSNPGNQLKWGEVATREIMDRFVAFLSSTGPRAPPAAGSSRASRSSSS